MKFLTPEECEISRKYEEMEKAWREAMKKWQDAVSGSNSSQDTRPLFDEYMRLCDEWDKFRRENSEILFASSRT